MSEDSGILLCCASCGIAEIDDIKLKKCTACYLVRYCGIKCQKDHRSKHKRVCKKRAAELRDELLFRQPESIHRGDCPICFLPMPIDETKSILTSCCTKLICYGCAYVDLLKMGEGLLKKYTCAFCRAFSVVTEEEAHKQRMKRVEANDPAALHREGLKEYEKGDYSGAFKYWTRAAELGDVGAHYELAVMYTLGHGVEKGSRKERCHLEEAAIAGHPRARHNLACVELNNGNIERAVKHWIIAAKQGHDDSIRPLMDVFRNGLVSKEDLDDALHAHQAAVDATKSPQREAAEEFKVSAENDMKMC